MIEITSEQIERVQLIMQNIPRGAQKVFSNAINRGLSKARTVTMQEVRRVYTVDSPTTRGQIQVNMASGGALVGSISYAGNMIPLIKFDVSPTGKTGHRQLVTARVLKASGKKPLGAAFNRNVGYGMSVLERIGKARGPLKGLYGPSLPQMAEKAEVREKAEEETRQTVEERIEHEMWRLLNMG